MTKMRAKNTQELFAGALALGLNFSLPDRGIKEANEENKKIKVEKIRFCD